MKTSEISSELRLKMNKLSSCYQSIKEDFGIQLNLFELLALSNYINSFAKAKFKGDAPLISSLQSFMEDYFGLDKLLLGKFEIETIKYGKRTFKNYGMNFLDTEPFKEYCRRNVNFWRDQRTLL